MNRLIDVVQLLVFLSIEANAKQVAPDIANFVGFASKFGKAYKDWDEFTVREAVYSKNMKIAVDSNLDPANHYLLGATTFSDWTDLEFQRILMHDLPNPDSQDISPGPERDGNRLLQKATCGTKIAAPNNNNPLPAPIEATPDLPDTSYTSDWDWRTLGAVNTIKDQGQCGSCYTFAATATIEGVHKVQTGKLLNMSEQQIVDCSTYSSGCNGGWPDRVLQSYYGATGTQTTLRSSYPYTATKGTCKYACVPKTGVQPTGLVSYSRYLNPNTSVAEFKSAAQSSPISIIITVGTVYRNYVSGVINNPACSEFTSTGAAITNHAVAVIGWGHDSVDEFWIIRNSWGTGWGERGYLRVKIDTDRTQIYGFCNSEWRWDKANVKQVTYA